MCDSEDETEIRGREGRGRELRATREGRNERGWGDISLGFTLDDRTWITGFPGVPAIM